MILRHWPSAWTWLSTVLMSSRRRAFRRQQLMSHRHEMLGDDVQAGVRHQVVNVGNPAGDRVLDRDHPELGLTRGDRGKRILERRARHRLVVGIDFARGEVGIRPRLALKHDLLGCGHDGSGTHAAFASQPSISRARSKSAGVSTPSGTLSTMVTSMRMPASSARNCSSFSRCSSGDGGRPTKRASAARR